MPNKLRGNVPELEEWELTISQDYILRLLDLNKNPSSENLAKILEEWKKIIDKLKWESLFEFLELVERFKGNDIFSNIQDVLQKLDAYLELKMQETYTWKKVENIIEN